jgi:sister-chromatid-cohesion protein PDS5
MSRYIEMYITCIATQDNIPYLYHLALKLKTVRDSESSDFDTVRPYLAFPHLMLY